MDDPQAGAGGVKWRPSGVQSGALSTKPEQPRMLPGLTEDFDAHLTRLEGLMGRLTGTLHRAGIPLDPGADTKEAPTPDTAFGHLARQRDRLQYNVTVLEAISQALDQIA